MSKEGPIGTWVNSLVTSKLIILSSSSSSICLVSCTKWVEFLMAESVLPVSGLSIFASSLANCWVGDPMAGTMDIRGWPIYTWRHRRKSSQNLHNKTKALGTICRHTFVLWLHGPQLLHQFHDHLNDPVNSPVRMKQIARSASWMYWCQAKETDHLCTLVLRKSTHTE